MRRAMLALALCACASQKSAESHADYVAQTQTVRTEGAERTVTVVREYAPGGQEKGPRSEHGPTTPQPPYTLCGARCETPLLGEEPNDTANRIAPQGSLIRETTTTIERAPVVTETHSGLDVKTEAESASASSFFKLSLWTKLLIAAGAALALLLAWRFRSGLLGGVLRVLGRG